MIIGAFMRLIPAAPLIVAILLSTGMTTSASRGEVVLAAVGDIMLAGSAAPVLKRHGLSHPFNATRSILKRSHIAIGNLEAPISSRGDEFRDKRFRFRAPPGTARALKDAGFSVLSLANNHMMDFGTTGLNDTLAELRQQAILPSGAGMNLDEARQPAIVTVSGKSIAFLSYSLTYPAEFFATRQQSGTAPGYKPLVRSDILRARQLADHVVVSFHWGKELDAKPSPYQTRAAREAIDAGADLVLGHHPHVLQGIERYKGGLICYSLGNYAFGSRSRHADRSIIALISFDGGVKNMEIVPLNVLNRDTGYQPKPLQGAAGQKVVDYLASISEGMGTRFTREEGRFMVR